MNQGPSISTENFIKALYKFEEGDQGDTKPGVLARELGITSAAVTDMARKLALKKLVEYEKYKQIRLTPEGMQLALSVIRKHRLWETFLYQVFGLSTYEIHREAESLEHVTSDFLEEKISKYLGNPVSDPHGDPIPDKRGTISSDSENLPLSAAIPGGRYRISRLSGSDKEFFDFCHANHLRVGSNLSVRKQYKNNGMTEIEVNQIRILLNTNLADRIYVHNRDITDKSDEA